MKQKPVINNIVYTFGINKKTAEKAKKSGLNINKNVKNLKLKQQSEVNKNLKGLEVGKKIKKILKKKLLSFYSRLKLTEVSDIN